MPQKTINQLQYPANLPSTDNFYYMCWITKLGFDFADYRAWQIGGWILNQDEEVISFIEEGRKAI